jgi:ABC-2 type transport system ATP-binding protein
MSTVISSDKLSKRFDARHAVMDLDLRVRPGVVTAFLGPNGAGKTTTICLLLGLLRPDGGACTVLEHPPGHPDALRQIGSLVEHPALYDHLTGQENLEVNRLLRGLPASEIDRVLRVVGLIHEARRPVHTYSLGMRQRLGVALALMGHPSLLILDEPTNGLDPVGIQEMRTLLRSLSRETGVSIFLSSHLLAEVEQVAEDLVVIHQGRLRYQGPLEDLGSAHHTELSIRVQDPGMARSTLQARGVVFREAEGRFWVQAPLEAAPEVAAHLVSSGSGLLELVPRRENLESRFLALLGEP